MENFTIGFSFPCGPGELHPLPSPLDVSCPVSPPPSPLWTSLVLSLPHLPSLVVFYLVPPGRLLFPFALAKLLPFVVVLCDTLFSVYRLLTLKAAHLMDTVGNKVNNQFFLICFECMIKFSLTIRFICLFGVSSLAHFFPVVRSRLLRSP